MTGEEARALLETRRDLPVVAVHDALVFDLVCSVDGETHAVLVCASCGLHDTDDEDRPDVAALLTALRAAGDLA